MNIFLVSSFDNKNGLVDRLKPLITKSDNCVIVASNPSAGEAGDAYFAAYVEKLKAVGLTFKNYAYLDGRNRGDAERLIKNADFIWLMGGNPWTQMCFFEEIGLKPLLFGFGAPILGTSAGAMNLTETVINFPEAHADLQNPREYAGLGFCAAKFLPHMKRKRYQLKVEKGIKPFRDYIAPLSFKYEMLGFPNGSFLHFDGENAARFGKTYLVKDGKVKRIKNS